MFSERLRFHQSMTSSQKCFYRRTLVKYMANSFTRRITLSTFWRRFNIHFPKALAGWKNIVDEFELKTSYLFSMVILSGSSYTALGVNVCSLK